MKFNPELPEFFAKKLGFFRLRGVSLKSRLRSVFNGLMVLAILFSGLLIFEQHKIVLLEAKLASGTYDEIVQAIRMRETLFEIDRKARLGEVDNLEISRFRNNLVTIRKVDPSPQTRTVLKKLSTLFEAYLQAVHKHGPGPSLRVRYEDVAASLGSFVEMQENSVYRMAEDINRDHGNSVKGALSFLIGFILLIMIGGNKIISVITTPLSDLVRFLDGVDVEEDLPTHVPRFNSSVTEVSLVANSFDRLLKRLRAYKAINLRRLLMEKRRADIIAASISDGVFLMRGEEILYLNSKAEKILGITIGKIQARAQNPISLSELGKGGPNQGLTAIRNSMVRTLPVELEIDIDGKPCTYLIRSYPVPQDLIEKFDQSADPALDVILERFNVDTLVLAQDVTIVRESQDAKSHFLGTLSHEVKTPVTSLTMATHLLRKSIHEIPNPSHRSLIETCADDVDRLRRLLDEFLTVSRFDNLTQRLEIKTLNLGKLLRHSVQSFQVQAHDKQIQLSFQNRTPQAETSIRVDATKVAWAVSNLLTNAIRHTPRGGKVTAVLEVKPEWAEIRVQDTGPGIELNRQEKIFDKFNSFYDIRVARSGGAGVGLAIAREIVNAHGGRIWVSSPHEGGEGAEFCFTIPLGKTKVPHAPQVPEEPVVNDEVREIVAEISESEAVENRIGKNSNLSVRQIKKGATGGTTARSG